MKKIILITGAYLGFLIGSGVATGQELMQYYAPYGWHMFGTALVIAVILIAADYCFAHAGRYGEITKGSDVFAYYCGNFAGRVFDIFSVIFCYMSFIVMLSGAAATLMQEYGLSLYIGGGITAFLVMFTVTAGFRKLVEVIGSITPIMIISIAFILIISLFKNAHNIQDNIAAIESGEIEIMKAGTNWFMSALSNGGFCILWLAGFSATLGKKEDFNTLVKSIILSSFILVAVNCIISFSILARIDVVNKMQIPNLFIASEIWKPAGSIFGVLIFAAIYTSACPLLWTAVDRFASEKTIKYNLLTGFLTLAGLITALYLPFNMLMHYIYVINGYLGFIILLIMMIQILRKKLFRQ